MALGETLVQQKLVVWPISHLHRVFWLPTALFKALLSQQEQSHFRMKSNTQQTCSDGCPDYLARLHTTDVLVHWSVLHLCLTLFQFPQPASQS